MHVLDEFADYVKQKYNFSKGGFLHTEDLSYEDRLTDMVCDCFYIRQNAKTKHNQNGQFACQYDYTTIYDLKLVAKFTKKESQLPDLFSIVNVITSKFDTKIKSTDDNTSLIYKNETGSDLLNKDFYIIEIDFELCV